MKHRKQILNAGAFKRKLTATLMSVTMLFGTLAVPASAANQPTHEGDATTYEDDGKPSSFGPEDNITLEYPVYLKLNPAAGEEKWRFVKEEHGRDKFGTWVGRSFMGVAPEDEWMYSDEVLYMNCLKCGGVNYDKSEHISCSQGTITLSRADLERKIRENKGLAENESSEETPTRATSGTYVNWQEQKAFDDNVVLMVRGTFSYREGVSGLSDSATVTNVSTASYVMKIGVTLSNPIVSYQDNQGTHLPPLFRKYAYAQHKVTARNTLGNDVEVMFQLQVNTAGTKKMSSSRKLA